MLKKFIRDHAGGLGTKNDANREQWVKTVLSGLPAGVRLLDAGAGPQRFRQYCAHLHYVSQDFCQYKGDGDGRALQTGTWDTSKVDIISDINAIPEKDGSFDAILCTEVLEHIPDPVSALKEFYRLLRPGGELILTAPFCSLTHMAPYHFYTGFNRYFYEHHLPAIGFTITEITANGDYSEYTGQELRRILTMYQRVPLYVKVCVALLLRFLGKKHDPISSGSELLCYGYHVRAVKKGRT